MILQLTHRGHRDETEEPSCNVHVQEMRKPIGELNCVTPLFVTPLFGTIKAGDTSTAKPV